LAIWWQISNLIAKYH